MREHRPAFQPRLDKLSPHYLSLEDMLEACATGDSHAWQVFIEVFQPVISAATAQKVASIKPDWACKIEAEDVVEIIYCALLRDSSEAVKRIRSSKTIVAYLRSMVSHTIADMLRKLESHDLFLQSDFPKRRSPVRPDEAAMWAERDKLVEKALETLSREERVLVDLYYFQNMPYKDIAEQLGTRMGSVASRMNRVKAKLKRITALREILTWGNEE